MKVSFQDRNNIFERVFVSNPIKIARLDVVKETSKISQKIRKRLHAIIFVLNLTPTLELEYDFARLKKE